MISDLPVLWSSGEPGESPPGRVWQAPQWQVEMDFSLLSLPFFFTLSLTGQCRCAHSKMTVPPEMKGYLHAAIMMAMVMVMAMEAAIIWRGRGLCTLSSFECKESAADFGATTLN